MLEFANKIEQEIPQDDSAELEEKLLLYSLIRSLNPKVCIETGTHRGKTSLYMANALYDNYMGNVWRGSDSYDVLAKSLMKNNTGAGHLWTADPFDWGQLGNFRKVPELENLITYERIEGKKLDVDNIDFAFIDGFHEKDIVLEEIEHFLPRLNKNAIMVFHDCDDVPESWESMVNGAVKEAGIKTIYLPTKNRMRIYEHSQI